MRCNEAKINRYPIIKGCRSMKVYTVLIVLGGAKCVITQIFSDFQLAKDFAIEATRQWEVENVIPNPSSETLESGETSWEIAGNLDDLVSITEQEVQTPQPQADDFNVNSELLVAPISQDNPMDPELPAGWDYDDKPIRMKDLLVDPASVKPTSSLTKDQRYALAIARVSKRPHLSCWPYTNQRDALFDLKGRTALGQQIVEEECNF